MKSSTPDWLLAGILAGAGFLVTFIFVGLNLPVSLIIAALFLAAGTQFFRRAAKLPEVPGAVNPAELEAALAEGARKLQQIRALGKRLQNKDNVVDADPRKARGEGGRGGSESAATWYGAGNIGSGNPVPAKIAALCRTVDKILAEIRRDSDDLKRARQFLSYYLDSTITILEKYEKLIANPVRDEKIGASIERVEAMLDTIGKAFEKQLANLLSNDVMDLDAELALLENTINMEGLGD